MADELIFDVTSDSDTIYQDVTSIWDMSFLSNMVIYVNEDFHNSEDIYANEDFLNSEIIYVNDDADIIYINEIFLKSAVIYVNENFLNYLNSHYWM